MRFLGGPVFFYGRALFRTRLPVARARLRIYGDAFALACVLMRKIARIWHDVVFLDNFPVV